MSQTPHGTKVAIKTAVRVRDGMRCTQCGLSNAEHLDLTGKSLHVHRLQPGSPYTLEGCVTLCFSCHATAPKRKRGEPDVEVNGSLVRLNPIFDGPLAALCERNASNATQEVNRALRVLLVREGLWPPPQS
jgi:hypothetical protein